jgi:MFS transporter, PAT family, beta-lactamase induction signal transducer AmpG
MIIDPSEGTGPRDDSGRGGPSVSPPAARGRHPWIWAALYFPYGLTFGFPAIALGYLASRAGIPVSAIAGVIGMPLLAAGWKFVWAPLGDYTLSRKRWYRIAITGVSIGFIAMASVPLEPKTMPLLALIVLLTSIAGTFIAFATEGLMTHNTSSAMRGRAGGWFQSGNQFAQTAGGGLGLWLMGHLPAPWMAGAVLAAILWLCSLALFGLEEPPRHLRADSVAARAADAWRELVTLVRSRAGRIGLILAILPIGTGAAQSLFGSLAPEWRAPADTVSAVLGLGGGLAIVLGCFIGGRLADAIAKPSSYAVSCALGVLACFVIAWSPRTSAGYAVSTLFYTFTLGMAAATMTAFVLAIIGDTAAATKINLFFALNTLFSLGMLRVDGWAHDAWRSTGMLYTEALVGVAALLLFIVLAKRVRGAELPGEPPAAAPQR